MKPPVVSRRLARWACATFASFAFVALAAHNLGADAAARMEEVVQKHVTAQQFTGAVLVAKRGATLFDRAYGSANREWDIANTPPRRTSASVRSRSNSPPLPSCCWRNAAS